MRISELAAATGCNLETIRYYERIALLPEPPRLGTYRRYGAGDVARLEFIMRCRHLGFSLEETRSLLGLSTKRDDSCAAVDVIVQTHLEQIEARQRALAEMAADLRGMLAACAQDTVATCNVVRTLAH
jgi:MerR family transcriptional regulator, mercuric resistance operon regulatory protein